MCGKVEASGPGDDHGWRAIDSDGVRFYVCPAELPPDGSTKEAYASAYYKVIRHIAELMNRAGANTQIHK